MDLALAIAHVDAKDVAALEDAHVVFHWIGVYSQSESAEPQPLFVSRVMRTGIGTEYTGVLVS